MGTIGLLTRLAKLVHKRSTEEVLGMRLRQYQLLYALNESAPMRQQDLCERLWLDPNNCVLLLNEVEALGWAERRRDPEDRRRHVVDITPEGRRAFERAQEAQAGLEGEVLGALSTEERPRCTACSRRRSTASGAEPRFRAAAGGETGPDDRATAGSPAARRACDAGGSGRTGDPHRPGSWDTGGTRRPRNRPDARGAGDADRARPGHGPRPGACAAARAR